MEARRQSSRTAVHLDIAEHTVLVRAGLRCAVGIEIDVIGAEQIEPAIAIVIDPRAARAPVSSIAANASPGGHVRKSAIAIVVVENVLAPVGDEQVLESVIVVVADANTHGPTGSEQARLRGYIGEGPVAIVLVEPVGCP